MHLEYLRRQAIQPYRKANFLGSRSKTVLKRFVEKGPGCGVGVQHVVDAQRVAAGIGGGYLCNPFGERVDRDPVHSVDLGRPGAEPLASFDHHV